MSKAKKAAAPKAKAEKVASATTSRTGQVGAAETTVTQVEDANDQAAAASKSQADANESQASASKSSAASTKAGAKEAPAREGHAVGVPRKSMEAKFGPKNPDTAETARRQAAVGGI